MPCQWQFKAQLNMFVQPWAVILFRLSKQRKVKYLNGLTLDKMQDWLAYIHWDSSNIHLWSRFKWCWAVKEEM